MNQIIAIPSKKFDYKNNSKRARSNRRNFIISSLSVCAIFASVTIYSIYTSLDKHAVDAYSTNKQEKVTSINTPAYIPEEDDGFVKDIILDSKIILEEGQTTKLSVKITPENATNKQLRVTLSDESVIKIDQGANITALRPRKGNNNCRNNFRKNNIKNNRG